MSVGDPIHCGVDLASGPDASVTYEAMRELLAAFHDDVGVYDGTGAFWVHPKFVRWARLLESLEERGKLGGYTYYMRKCLARKRHPKRRRRSRR